MRNRRCGRVRLFRLRTGDCTSGEPCMGYAETIPRSLLGIISGSEGGSSPGGECHGRVWPGCVRVWGRGAVTLLRNRAALWLCIAPVCRLPACPAACVQPCWWSDPSLSYRQPLSRAKPFTNPCQCPATRFSLVCNTPWLFLLPHLCSLMCLQERRAGNRSRSTGLPEGA